MKEYDILNRDGLSVDLLTRLSYKSELGISLKKTLRHFNKEELFAELININQWYDMQDLLYDIVIDYRIKSEQSARLKYYRYIEGREAEKVFNDLLGFRTLCDSYKEILALKSKQFYIVDMSKGKAHDDGYRGVHVYFQIDHFHYPIEIQYNTYYDRQINNWLHKYLYKKQYPNNIGQKLRLRYEQGYIKNEFDFKEVFKDVLFNS